MQNNLQKQSHISIFTLGLAVFAMLFGAGNIIFPIRAGVLAGSKNFFSISGFLLTAAFLPAIGLVSMILFNGDFKKFFGRLGKIPGFMAILFCMFVIGPVIAIPRCITVPFSMISIFLPTYLTLPIFTVSFCLITFLLTYKENTLLDLLGKFIGPVKIATLSLIAILGLCHPQLMETPIKSSIYLFAEQFMQGFQTLDLLATLFFGFIILKLLKSSNAKLSQKEIAILSLKGGLIGSLLLAIFYVAYSYVGAFYGNIVDKSSDGAEMFSAIVLHVVGVYGAVAIIVTTMIACFSTAAALSTIFAEYLKIEIFKNKINYVSCLIITLTITTIIANFGLFNILKYSAPFIDIGYPIIITIVVCNLAYKLVGFTWIKLPVAIIAITMIGLKIYSYLAF